MLSQMYEKVEWHFCLSGRPEIRVPTLSMAPNLLDLNQFYVTGWVGGFRKIPIFLLDTLWFVDVA